MTFDLVFPSDIDEKIVVLRGDKDTVIFNLFSDIDGTNGAISGTTKLHLDHNPSTFIATKAVAVSIESCRMCNCTDNQPLICTTPNAVEKHVQHGTNGKFEVVPKETSAKQPSPEPLLPESPPISVQAMCTATSIDGETRLMNKEK